MTGWMLAATMAFVAVGAFVQGATGFGFALIVGPVLAAIEPTVLPVALLATMIPLNIYIAARERFAIDRPAWGWLTLGRVGGTIAGAAVLALLPADQLAVFVGATTILAALASLVCKPFHPGRNALTLVGAITGVTETATGIGGPPLALAFQHRPAPVLRSSVALAFLTGEIISLAALAPAHRLTAHTIQAGLILLPAVLAGMALSHLVFRSLRGQLLRILVLAFAVVSGAAAIITN